MDKTNKTRRQTNERHLRPKGCVAKYESNRAKLLHTGEWTYGGMHWINAYLIKCKEEVGPDTTRNINAMISSRMGTVLLWGDRDFSTITDTVKFVERLELHYVLRCSVRLGC